MNKDEILNHIIAFIKKNADVTVEQKDYDSDLTELGVDSIFALELANEMEELLDIVIDDRDIEKLRSINSIMEYFQAIRNEK